jgi:hypothetical protein
VFTIFRFWLTTLTDIPEPAEAVKTPVSIEKERLLDKSNEVPLIVIDLLVGTKEPPVVVTKLLTHAVEGTLPLLSSAPGTIPKVRLAGNTTCPSASY